MFVGCAAPCSAARAVGGVAAAIPVIVARLPGGAEVRAFDFHLGLVLRPAANPAVRLCPGEWVLKICVSVVGGAASHVQIHTSSHRKPRLEKWFLSMCRFPAQKPAGDFWGIGGAGLSESGLARLLAPRVPRVGRRWGRLRWGRPWRVGHPGRLAVGRRLRWGRWGRHGVAARLRPEHTERHARGAEASFERWRHRVPGGQVGDAAEPEAGSDRVERGCQQDCLLLPGEPDALEEDFPFLMRAWLHSTLPVSCLGHGPTPHPHSGVSRAHPREVPDPRARAGRLGSDNVCICRWKDRYTDLQIHTSHTSRHSPQRPQATPGHDVSRCGLMCRDVRIPCKTVHEMRTLVQASPG